MVLKLTEIVDSIIGENIAYRMALGNDIVNYSALAKKIKKKVDELSGKDVPLNTIVKLLTRYKKKNTYPVEPAQALKQVAISLDYGYSIKTIKPEELMKNNFIIAIRNGDRYDVLLKDDMDKDMALLMLKMKKNFSEIPGITVLVISILDMFGIRTRYIYRIGHEILVLLNQKDAPKALEKLAFYSSIQKD